eukprot:5932751-Amphidinium_carterae.1
MLGQLSLRSSITMHIQPPVVSYLLLQHCIDDPNKHIKNSNINSTRNPLRARKLRNSRNRSIS